MRNVALILLLGFVSLGNLRADEVRKFTGQYPPDLPEAKSMVYKTVGDVTLQAFIYEPDRTAFPGPRPAIVFFFGGGWNGGSPNQFENQCLALAARGMVAITADYRVKSRHDVSPFECVADAKSAIRWVRKNAAQLQIDPDKVVASGGSAGGHIACCTGVIPGLDEPGEDLSISSVPNAMALFNPAVMMTNFGDYKLLDEEKNKDIAERTLGRPSELSPIEFVRPKLPPTIIFHGTDDEAVPFPTVELFTKLMQENGNRCELKSYPGQPHGFFNPRLRDPARADDELKNYLGTLKQLDEFLVSLGYLEPVKDKSVSHNIQMRGSLTNSLAQFRDNKTGTVTFLGGSITEMNGYRPLVSESLQKRFPGTKFQFINAGIASTGSTTGAFRFSRDVLSQRKLDLLFVEFAVNDDQDSHLSRQQSIRGMEGLIRQARAHNSNVDIVITYFVNPEMRDLLQHGQEPVSIAAHRAVAEHYQIPTIHLAREVAEQIDAGKLTWEKFGGTHPAPFGNRLCADMIDTLLDRAWSADTKPVPHTMPAALDEGNFGTARFLDLKEARIETKWKIEVPDWNSLPGSKRDRFTSLPMLCATEPGATFEMTFEGQTAIAYVSAGPDAGILEVSVDGGSPRQVDLYHHFSKGLHYPRSVILATDLPSGKHTLTVVLSADKNESSVGTAARIMELGVN
jgi:acetyl esterase/lipase/lysophospholipase L1-like esterase